MFTERQLALCKKHDPQSQQELYDLFKARVMGLCRRYSKCREEAEDIFQETFISVFNHIEQIRDSRLLTQWILKIAVNTAIKHFHRNKRFIHALEQEGADSQTNDHELILSHFTDEMLVDLINQLPDGYRMVFNLYVIEGYSHAEIGEMLHISEASSRSQFARAKQSLRNTLLSLGILRFEKYA
jgi:RNA polymerase sigma-70 factor (ECF subfamily)